MEAFAVVDEIWPGFFKVSPPCYERFVVVRAEVVPVLHDEQALDRGADMRDGRDEAVREYVTPDPGVGNVSGRVSADRVQQEQAVRLEQALDRFHERAIVLGADVLEHPEGHNAVKLTLRVTIVFEPEFHR